ncbi:DNA-directed RNA polymerase subunit K [Candidatus Nitrosocosmicus hydrocola]|uniref:DNA-directed RNA polymerase subunit K n=1 Tax=Candidatus Nitrosocosmicus hydrocola TaxID=1826872 RepID=UPI0018C88F27|nr:DNA-directed RNA polymerase subunit K [Candidatus Nitrosocosmicus hydrocola]
MAIKRTKKKSGSKKTNDIDKGSIGENSENSLEVESAQSQLESISNDVEVTKKYKTYDADVEFKLREVTSKNDEIIIGPNRLTRFEKARITGARSLQLSLGAPILTKIPSELTDTIMIARYELEKKTLPISIRRILPNGLFQDIPIEWTV